MTKLLVIFLLVVVAIFVFASVRTQPTGDDFINWLKDRQASFDRTPRVNLRDVRCSYLREDILVIPRLTPVVCTIDPLPGIPSRKLTVALATAGRLRVSFNPAPKEKLIMRSPERDCDQQHPHRDFLIGEEGGTITLTSLDAVPLLRVKLH